MGPKPKPKKPPVPEPEYISYRPGRVPALNFGHPRLVGWTPAEIEKVALGNPVVSVRVKDIICVGNHQMDHFASNWWPLSMNYVTPELHDAHMKVLEKHSKMHTMLLDAGVGLGNRLMKHVAFKERKVRLLELPPFGSDVPSLDTDKPNVHPLQYAVVGGVFRTSWANIKNAATMNAHIATFEDLEHLLKYKKILKS